MEEVGEERKVVCVCREREGGEAVPRGDRGSVTRDAPKTYRLHNKMVNKIIFRHTASTIPGPADNSATMGADIS